MKQTNIVFLGSKPIGYECFNYLISQKEKLNLNIMGLLTQSRKEFGNAHDLTALAAENNIPLINSLEELPVCDILYSVQYHQILKVHHITKASQIAVNLHMAPLPEYRGSNQFSFAILDGKKEFGTTIHQIDPRIDHGGILFARRFPIPENCWVNDLYKTTFDESLSLFQETLEKIVTGNYEPIPQEGLTAKYGTSLHFRSEMSQIKVIDLSWEQDKIEKHIRASSMPGFEPPYCIIGGQKVYFSTKWQ